MSIGEVVRSVVIAAFVAAVVGGAAHVIGLDGPHSIAVGAGVLALVLILLAQRSIVPTEELEPPELDPPGGGRRDVEQLAWSMVEHRTRIRGIVLDRVEAIAVRRLAAHDLDPRRAADSAAIEALLGATAWSVLQTHRDRTVTPRALDATLQALERLPPPGPLTPARTIPTDRTSRAD